MRRKIGKISRLGIWTEATGKSYIGGTVVDPGRQKWRFEMPEGPDSYPVLSVGDWVSFIRTVDSSGDREIASDVRHIQKEADSDLFEQSFLDSDTRRWSAVTRQYFSMLDSESVVAAALKKLESVQARVERKFILDRVPLDAHLVPQAVELRRMMSDSSRRDLCLRILKTTQQPIPSWFHKEFVRLQNRLAPYEIKVQRLPTQLSPDQPRPKSAPTPRYIAVRPQPVSRVAYVQTEPRDLQRMKHWKSVIDRCQAGPSVRVEWQSREVYTRLAPTDWELARIWCGKTRPGDGKLAQMLSARAAERVAYSLYESLSHRVVDTSDTQRAAPNGGDWKTHDLILDGAIPIDVKNARSPAGNKVRYVRHCVARFKETRSHQSASVKIAGVFSPYLRLQYIEDPNKIDFQLVPITFLGETTRNTVEALAEKYASEHVRFDLLTRYRTRHAASYTSDGFVYVFPPWVFDYPDRVYRENMSAQADLRELFQRDELTYEDSRQWNLQPIGAFLAAGIELPRGWKLRLSSHEVELYRRLQPVPGQRLKLPDLFLTILTHFLDMLRSVDSSDFHPNVYEVLIFGGEGKFRRRHPLGLYDPLETCWALCDALKTLWDNCRAGALSDFCSFRFQGLGLLRGMRKGSGHEQTLLAYCGGAIPEKGKCGFSPLIWGEHKSCPKCGYLVCPIPECQHCSNGCSEFERRHRDIYALPPEPPPNIPAEPPWLHSEEWDDSW